jgi:hypothetical protein
MCCLLKKLTENILLGANVVDDFAFSVNSLIIVLYYHKNVLVAPITVMSISVLSFETDNFLSLVTNVCKTYILNTKHIWTNMKLYFQKSSR